MVPDNFIEQILKMARSFCKGNALASFVQSFGFVDSVGNTCTGKGYWRCVGKRFYGMVVGEGNMHGPLSGVRVLDFTHWWSGPEATTVLAALGADVIKVEGPKRPDSSRALYVTSMSVPQWFERGSVFNGANAGKRGLTLDLSQARGLELIRQLVAQADVVINNFSARVMTNLGLAHEDLVRIKPDIVTVDMTSFGLTGPWKDLVGFAYVFEQLGGAAWLTGFEDGPPENLGGASDACAGYLGALMVLLGLTRRDDTGEAQHFDISQTEGIAAYLGPEMIEAQLTGVALGRHGNRHASWAPHNVYPCTGEDEWVALAVRNDEEWMRLVAVLGSPEWAHDPQLAHAEGRKARETEIDGHIAAWTASRNKTDVADALWAVGLASGELTEGAEVEHDRQFVARGVFQHFVREPVGEIALPVVPLRLSDKALPHSRAAPRLGEHSAEVLQELLGLSDGEIAALEKEAVIGCGIS